MFEVKCSTDFVDVNTVNDILVDKVLIGIKVHD